MAFKNLTRNAAMRLRIRAVKGKRALKSGLVKGSAYLKGRFFRFNAAKHFRRAIAAATIAGIAATGFASVPHKDRRYAPIRAGTGQKEKSVDVNFIFPSEGFKDKAGKIPPLVEANPRAKNRVVYFVNLDGLIPGSMDERVFREIEKNIGNPNNLLIKTLTLNMRSISELVELSDNLAYSQGKLRDVLVQMILSPKSNEIRGVVIRLVETDNAYDAAINAVTTKINAKVKEQEQERKNKKQNPPADRSSSGNALSKKFRK